MTTPLLILSDAPTAPTGLGRIARELASQINVFLKDVFRVAVCGPGGTYGQHLGYPIYPVRVAPDMSIPELPGVWNDFAGAKSGIILCIWNPSWLQWLANPSELSPSDLKTFLLSGLLRTWLYAPIDAEGPAWRLPESQEKILNGFNRVLACTGFGASVIEATMGTKRNSKCSYLPHGIDTVTFRPMPRGLARMEFLPEILGRPGKLGEDIFLLGAIATNTPRKDWGLCFEVCAELLSRGENIGLWAHTDQFQKPGAWDLLMLAKEFGMHQRTIFTNGHIQDTALRTGYNACDVVLSIGSGEGWGYCAAEALACGVPCIHGNYGGSAEFVPYKFLVDPAAYRLDGYYGLRRPVFRPVDWANAVMFHRGTVAELDPRFSWDGCWPAWEKWLREGVGQ